MITQNREGVKTNRLRTPVFQTKLMMILRDKIPGKKIKASKKADFILLLSGQFAENGFRLPEQNRLRGTNRKYQVPFYSLQKAVF